MSAFQTTPKEYLDICICMLMDVVRDGDSFVSNTVWGKLITRLTSLGLKSIILPLYLDTDINARIKYKILSKALKGDDGCYIHIKPDDTPVMPPDSEVLKTLNIPEIPKVNKELIKKIFKKVKEVRFKTSMPITEDKMNRIIDYVVKKDQEEKEDGRV